MDFLAFEWDDPWLYKGGPALNGVQPGPWQPKGVFRMQAQVIAATERDGLTARGGVEFHAAAWLLSHRNQRTRAAYAADLRSWAAWLEGRDPLLVGRVDADVYCRELEHDGLAVATVARRLSALTGFYAYLVDEDVVARNPFSRVKRPRAGDDSPTLGLDASELAAVLERAAGDLRACALICLLGFNGLRISEALQADVEDLGESRGHRTLTITRKGGRRAVMPLAAKTAHAIASLLGGRETGPVFITATGARWDRRAAHRVVARLIGDGFSPHSLRHTFVTLALDAGASLRDVQDAAGHADPRTTRRYDRGRYSLDRNPTHLVAASVG